MPRYDPDRDGIFCVYCGAGLNLHNATHDHIVPLSKNGSNGRRNRVACCKKCNSEKRDMSLDEFRQFRGGGVFPHEHRLGEHALKMSVKDRIDWY